MPRTEFSWTGGGPPALHRPVFVVALTGLFDVAHAATTALEHLVAPRTVETVAAIDPDGFYDFTQERPRVWLDDEGDRHIAWPANDVQAVRYPGGSHDLLVLSGVEPHLRWKTFAGYLVEVAEQARCELFVTLGAAAEAVPHTRTPIVVGSSTTEELCRRLGLSRPQYQGPTGLFGVLHQLLDAGPIPAISLRVPVPHYLANATHPKSTAALLTHLEHVLGIPTRPGELAGEIEHWQQLHDEAVATDAQAASFVRLLESEYDRRTEAAIPSADDLATEVEQFLRDHRPGEPHEPDDGGP